MFNLITGSSRGLGFFLAEGFKKKNREIILNSSSKNNLEKAAKKLNCLSFVADLTNYEDCLKLMEKIEAQGKLSSIICNVGYSKSSAKNAEDSNEWINSLNKNLMTTVNVVNAVREVGCYDELNVICISSICSLQYIEGAPIEYGVSKSALNTYVKFMSKKLINEKIRINSIISGNLNFKDSLWKKKSKDTIEKVLSSVPVNRFGNPDDILNIIEFLLSNKSSFLLGSSILADGGQTIIS